MRFHGTLRPGARLIEGDLDPDWDDRGALIGTLVQDGHEQVVALASYARLRDPAVAEVAFAVAERLQRLGVGTRLLEQLARPGVRCRHRAADLPDPLAERRHARGRGRCRIRRDAAPRGRRDRGHDVDRADRRVAGATRRARPRRRGRVAAALPPARQPGGGRCLGAARDDRRRALPQRRVGRVRRPCLPGQPQRRGGRRSAGGRRRARDRRRRRTRRHLRPRGRRARGCGGRARGRRARALCDLGRLRGGRRGGSRAAGTAACARALVWRPDDRAELPRSRLYAGAAERDVRRGRAATGVASASPRRAGRSGSRLSSRRAGAASGCRRSCHWATRRTCRRTTSSSTGRTTLRRTSSLSTWRASAIPSASAGSPAASRAASRCSRSRAASALPERGPLPLTPPRWRARRPRSRRSSTRPACSACARCRSCSTRPLCSPPSRCRRVRASRS